MGKEKENFEVWSLPRSRGKPGTRANPTEHVRNNLGSNRGKEKLAEGAIRKPEAKGMKRTSTSLRVDVNFLDRHEEPRVGEGETIRNGEQGSRALNSPSPGVDDFSVPEKTAMEKLKGKRVAMASGTAEVNNGSKMQSNVPQSEDVGLEKGSPAYRNTSRLDRNKKHNVSPERMRSRMSGRLSPQRRQTMKFVEDSPDSREQSNLDGDKQERRRSESHDSYSSHSEDRARKEVRRQHERRHRRSYSYSEDEVYRSRRDVEVKSSRRYDGGRDRRYGMEYAESSMYRRRRMSGRSESEDGDRRAHNREERRRHNSSEEEGRRGRSQRVLAVKSNTPSPNDENARRRERRRKQKEREARRTQRENQGLKGHYIAVDEHGEPYGFGVGAWKQELNRLCSGLDPSVMDIRWQSEENMKLLRRRLKDNFEYSSAISCAYIRTLAGRNVTQRRNKIIHSMVDDAPAPAGMNAEVWRRLDRIRQNPRREELSQRMRYANSCRTNVGRTGPKGISGVRDDLREKLGREPDPEELEKELRRDKGYSGRSKKKKSPAPPLSSESDGEENHMDPPEDQGSSDEAPRQLMCVKDKAVDSGGGVRSAEKEYIRSLEKQIEELTAKKKHGGQGGGSICTAEGGPDFYSPEGTQRKQVESGSTTPVVDQRAQEGEVGEGNAGATEIAQRSSPTKRKRKAGRR